MELDRLTVVQIKKMLGYFGVTSGLSGKNKGDLNKILETKLNSDDARVPKVKEEILNIISPSKYKIPILPFRNKIQPRPEVEPEEEQEQGEQEEEPEEQEEPEEEILFEGVRYPRTFPDAERMNTDPDKYIQGMSTSELEHLVKLASYLYYNYEDSGITDNTFDAFEYNLNKRLNQRGRRYEKIGAPIIERLRVKLPYPMGSLQKIKPDTREFLDFISGAELAFSVKLDGVSGMIVYKNKTISNIYTRGDGTIGGNVTFLKDYVRVPQKVSQDIVVRGEFILQKEKWREKFSKTYSNPRAFVSGRINSGFISPDLIEIDFIAYEIVSLGPREIPEPIMAWEILREEGFNIVEHGFWNEPTAFETISEYKRLREISIYSVDGLVLTYNAPGIRKSVAFKMLLEEQKRKTKIINVEWNISRHGRYVPVAIYESVYIGGARFSRATAHNASHVRKWSLGKGTNITIARSGDIIPNIIDVEINDDIDPIYPPEEPSWHWDGVNIILDDIEGNPTVQIKRMLHFFQTIGVPRLGEKTIEKFYEAGMKTVKEVAAAFPKDFIKIYRIGEKLSKAHYENIHAVLKSTRIDRFIAATTYFQGIGKKLIRSVMRGYPEIMEDDQETIKKKLLGPRKVHGIGPKRSDVISENFDRFKEFLFSLGKDDIKSALEYEKTRAENLEKSGYNEEVYKKKFVMTGFFGKIDLNFEDYMYDNFAEIVENVDKTVECVIAANASTATDKMISAQSIGISVYTLDEFISKYDIDVKLGKKIHGE